MITRLNCSIFCRCSFVILLMSIFSIVNIHAHSDLHKLLDTLDNVIKNKLEYVDFKQKRIDSLKNEFTGNDTIALFRTAQAISIEYSSFQKDSALNYSMRMMNLANSTKKYELISKAKFNRARLLSSMGHFNEATNLVSSVNIGKLSHELKIEYFWTQITIYNHQKSFSTGDKGKSVNEVMAQSYRDSLLQCSKVPLELQAFFEGASYLYKKDYDKAIHYLDSAYLSYPKYSRNAGIIAYSLALAYQSKEDLENTMTFLATSSISDIVNGTRENLSLRTLARLIFNEDDIDRAYAYMKCAMEDAVLCNARLNTIEVSDMYLFIDKAFKEKERKKYIVIVALLISFCIISLLLIVSYAQLKKQRKKLKEANSCLYSQLDKIEKMNLLLTDSSKIKEEYIGLYMEQYTNYIEMTDEFKKKVLRIAKSGNMEKMVSYINISFNTEKEYANFYNNFDNTILTLFPTFVDEFNALLLPEYAIVPNQGKLLTPELRIFALIRLGITDSYKIAHLLHYSSSTIYNYRSKTKNKALGDRADFENKVMHICQQ